MNLLPMGKQKIIILSSVWLDEMDFCKTDVDNHYMSFAFVEDGEAVSEGTVLFTVPKYFGLKSGK